MLVSWVPGPKDGMLFQQSINPESFATIGIKKVLPDIESSMAYLTGGKLNDIQANKLIDNMSSHGRYDGSISSKKCC